MTYGDNPVSIYLLGIIAGAFSFIKGFQWLNKKRLIENIQASTIRSIAIGGPAEISGKAVPCVYKFRGPFTNKDCVHYKCTVERLIKDNHRGDEWFLMHTEEKGEYFYTQDDTGKVLVDTKGAKYEIPSYFELEIDVFSKDMPDSLRKYLEKNHLITDVVAKYKSRLRFNEYDIEVNDKLFVLGNAEENRLCDKSLLDTDAVNVMITKGDNRNKFIISKLGKKELLEKLEKNSFLAIYGGGGLIIACLYLLLMRFGLL